MSCFSPFMGETGDGVVEFSCVLNVVMLLNEIPDALRRPLY